MVLGILANQDRLKAERRAVKTGQSSGGDRFIAEYTQFCRDYPGFIIHPHFNIAVVVSMQSEFMASQLIKDPIFSNPSDPVEGIVSDAAHGFWREKNHLLIVSSIYSPLLNCWVPGVLSFSNGATAEHYQHHFRALFKSIAQQAEKRNIELQFHHFSGVIDFSDAERLGFIEAFVEFWVTTSGNKYGEPEELRYSAAKLLKGCREHFRANVTRISRIHAVVPHNSANAFKARMDTLLDVPDMKSFLAQATSLVKDFPKIAPWLSWWLKEEHASMLFLSQRTMSEFIWDSIPETTNAEEAMHWKLYSAVGRNHTFLEGLQALYKVAEYYQRMVINTRGNYSMLGYDVSSELIILAGNPVRYGKPEPWKAVRERIGRTKPSRAPGRRQLKKKNDGQPPDTSRELVRKSQKIRIVKKAVQEKHEKTRRMDLLVQKQKPISDNSCWLDATLEATFAVVTHDYGDFAMRFSNLPSTTPSYTLFSHFQKRHEQLGFVTQTKKLFLNGFSKNETNETRGWPIQFLADLIGTLPTDATGDMAVPTFKDLTSQLASVLPAIRTYYSKSLSMDMHDRFAGDFGAYLADYLPVERVQSTPPGAACWRSLAGQDTCGGVSRSLMFYLTMPVMLVVPQEIGMVGWSMPPVVQPWKQDSGTSELSSSDLSGITYDLVARIFGNGNHFVIRRITASGTVLSYDDLLDSERMQELANSSCTSHLAGRDEDLIPQEWSTHYTLYHLRGGLEAQQQIFVHQAAVLQKLYGLSVTQEHAGAAPVVGPPPSGFQEMSYKNWWWIERPVPTRRGSLSSRELYHSHKNLGQHDSEPEVDHSLRSLPTQREEKKHSHPIPPVAQASPPSSPMPMDCRCGTKGDGNAQADGLERDGSASSLKDADCWLCYICDIHGTLHLSQGSQRKKKLSRKKPRQKLSNRLLAGKGVLVRFGTYYYPARLLVPQWRVRWWRHCIFPQSAPPSESLVPESSIVDELWNDVDKRRKVRLGRWRHAHEILNDEDQLYDLNMYPFTEEIEQILAPHVDTLEQILSKGYHHFLDLPACNHANEAVAKAETEAQRQGMVPYYGSLDIVEQGQINNWITHRVSGAQGARHLWQGMAMNAHAATLVIAYRQRFEIRRDPTYPLYADAAELQAYTLKCAWNYQTRAIASKDTGFCVDVDHECLSLLEEHMFVCSVEAGIAGYQQWGLDVGDHQERWNPYLDLPTHWNHGDFVPEDEDEAMQVGGKDCIAVGLTNMYFKRGPSYVVEPENTQARRSEVSEGHHKRKPKHHIAPRPVKVARHKA
ncbi:hypothetical protein BC835DRAFT_1311235 [Cytidiella melzeri]|nr:hypothetical protein BC835DRAFT_1311235 [Cytidiella melzeri]